MKIPNEVKKLITGEGLILEDDDRSIVLISMDDNDEAKKAAIKTLVAGVKEKEPYAVKITVKALLTPDKTHLVIFPTHTVTMSPM